MLTSVQNLAVPNAPTPSLSRLYRHPLRSSHFGRLSRHRCCILKCRAVLAEEMLWRKEGVLCGPHLCLHPRSQSKRGYCLTNQKQSHIQVKSPCRLFDPERLWTIPPPPKHEHTMYTTDWLACWFPEIKLLLPCCYTDVQWMCCCSLGHTLVYRLGLGTQNKSVLWPFQTAAWTDNERFPLKISLNEMNIVHKMGIFTSVKLSSSFAPHERDRLGGERGNLSEWERQRGTDAVHGCVWQIVFAWGSLWCLYNVWVCPFVYVYSARASVGGCFE